MDKKGHARRCGNGICLPPIDSLMKQRVASVSRLTLVALTIAFAVCVKGGFFSLSPIIPMCKQIAPDEHSGFGPDGSPPPGRNSYSDAQTGTTKKALTWKIAKTQTVGNKTYVLFATDFGPSHISDAYGGDTSIRKRRPLLCLKKFEEETPTPAGLTPLDQVTPAGALTCSWSSARMVVIPNVLGSDLHSRQVANAKCNVVGLAVHGESGYRMAEFHDGKSKAWAGWSYWVEGYDVQQGLDVNAHYWIAINDQDSNPW